MEAIIDTKLPTETRFPRAATHCCKHVAAGRGSRGSKGPTNTASKATVDPA